MRGPATSTEGLFTMRRLSDSVSANHLLRRIRTMINEAMAKSRQKRFGTCNIRAADK